MSVDSANDDVAVFSPVAAGRTADEVTRQIELLVLEGVLAPGDRLPAERELSRQFDVSRPILRDALKALETSGLLVTRHGDGTVVADVTGQVFAPAVVDLISRHRKASADYLEFRRDMDGLAAEYAARRMTREDQALLEAILARMEDAHARADFAAEAEADVDFHTAIGECAHNIILLHTLRACYRLLSDGVVLNRRAIFGLPGARDALLAQHRAIGKAIIAGDAVEARRAAERHLDYVADALSIAERSDEWRRVSAMRLSQRSEQASRAERRRTG